VGAAAKQGSLSAPGDAQTAGRYAEGLLRALGQHPARPLPLEDEHPALSWARSGLMTLTGARDGAAQMCPVPLAACADGALAALASLAPAGAFTGLRGSRLLADRAAITGHTRNGAISPGGSCRLLEATDGRLALNLARDADWSLLPAWLERDDVSDWGRAAEAVGTRSVRELVERGRELGLAVAPEAPETGDRPPFLVSGTQGNGGLSPVFRPRVVDLSSLWAGPLCGHLLQRAGAEVIKVESLARPDGARHGPAAFLDLLNAGKASVALDFASSVGRAQLRELLLGADIVIEGSRPRALRQLGLEPRELLEARPALVWISITGYGRDPARENWIGYGDDAGVAAGLSAVMREATGQALIVGDAIADPLTGLHAALAAWARWRAGTGGMVALALRDVVAHCIGFDPPPEGWRARRRQWGELLLREGVEPCRPAPRRAAGLARPLGSDTGILAANTARAHDIGGAR
jgi:hypothetical protein